MQTFAVATHERSCLQGKYIRIMNNAQEYEEKDLAEKRLTITNHSVNSDHPAHPICNVHSPSSTTDYCTSCTYIHPMYR